MIGRSNPTSPDPPPAHRAGIHSILFSLWIQVPGGYKPAGTIGLAAVPQVGAIMNLNRDGIPLRFSILDVSTDTMDIFVGEEKAIVSTEFEKDE